MAVAFGAITKGKNDGNVTSISFTSPTVSGSDKVGSVHVLTNSASGDIVSGVTWGGVSMTRINRRASGTQNLYTYYLANPSSAASVVISCSATSAGIYGHALYYTGASQTGIPDSQNTGAATSNLTLSTTVVGTGCWLVSVARNALNGIPTAGTGTTVRENDAAYAIATGDSNGTVGTGSQSMGWNSGSGETWGCIYSIAPAGASTTIKTWDDIARANVKTLNGVASANIKTINGIT